MSGDRDFTTAASFPCRTDYVTALERTRASGGAGNSRRGTCVTQRELAACLRRPVTTWVPKWQDGNHLV